MSDKRREYQEKRTRQQVVQRLKNDQHARQSGKKVDHSLGKFNLQARKRKGAPAGSDDEDQQDRNSHRRGIGIDTLTNKSSRWEQEKLKKETAKFLQEKAQQREYQKLKEREVKRQRLMGVTDNVDNEENDHLVQLRGDDKTEQEKRKQKAEERQKAKELHREHITAAKVFILETLNRAKQSKYNMRNGKEPLNQYDTLVAYPLDVQAIPKQLGASPEVIAGIEYLQTKVKRVFDVAKKDDKKTGDKKKKKGDDDEQDDDDDEEEQDNKNQRRSKTKGVDWLELRNISLNDIAYMKKKQQSVEGVEKLLEKENQYQQMKEKLHKKKVVHKRLNYKTDRGQPLMKTHINHLLDKIKQSVKK